MSDISQSEARTLARGFDHDSDHDDHTDWPSLDAIQALERQTLP